jgi:DNA-binding transcriptional LysR family regulator
VIGVSGMRARFADAVAIVIDLERGLRRRRLVEEVGAEEARSTTVTLIPSGDTSPATASLMPSSANFDAALDGAGLAFVFEAQVEGLIAKRRLVRVLADWCPAYPGFFLYYPSRRQFPAALRAFVDFAKAPAKI